MGCRHPRAPLGAEGRRCLVARCRTRPVTHIAAEMGSPTPACPKCLTAGAAMEKPDCKASHRNALTPPQPGSSKDRDLAPRARRSAQRIIDELVELGYVIERRTVLTGMRTPLSWFRGRTPP
jgi:hypothetical protein